MALPERKLTAEGLEMQWAVNHLGHFYLTFLLWDKVQKADNFRVVNVSSLAHLRTKGIPGPASPSFEDINCKDYHPRQAYSKSKLYNVLFTRALA